MDDKLDEKTLLPSRTTARSPCPFISHTARFDMGSDLTTRTFGASLNLRTIKGMLLVLRVFRLVVPQMDWELRE